jgi:hypothetical protein
MREAEDAPAFLAAMALISGNEELARFGIGFAPEYGRRVHWWFNVSEEGWAEMLSVGGEKEARAELAAVALESILDMAARVRAGMTPVDTGAFNRPS